jgi:hypothetical protein
MSDKIEDDLRESLSGSQCFSTKEEAAQKLAEIRENVNKGEWFLYRSKSYNSKYGSGSDSLGERLATEEEWKIYNSLWGGN